MRKALLLYSADVQNLKLPFSGKIPEPESAVADYFSPTLRTGHSHGPSLFRDQPPYQQFSARFAAGRCAAAVADLSGCGGPHVELRQACTGFANAPDDRPWSWRTAGAGMDILRRHHAGRGALLTSGSRGKKRLGWLLVAVGCWCYPAAIT